MFNRKVMALSTFYSTLLDSLIETISTWSDFVYYANKLRAFRLKLIENGQKTFDAYENEFNTLIHGDFWTNNIMLKFPKHNNNDKNEFDNVALIDFQFCCWTSPAIDLHYFFNTSLNENVRLYQQDELLEYYHKMLSSTLIQLNYRKYVPTLHEFRLQFIAKSFYGMWNA